MPKGVGCEPQVEGKDDTGEADPSQSGCPIGVISLEQRVSIEVGSVNKSVVATVFESTGAVKFKGGCDEKPHEMPVLVAAQKPTTSDDGTSSISVAVAERSIIAGTVQCTDVEFG